MVNTKSVGGFQPLSSCHSHQIPLIDICLPLWISELLGDVLQPVVAEVALTAPPLRRSCKKGLAKSAPDRLSAIYPNINLRFVKSLGKGASIKYVRNILGTFWPPPACSNCLQILAIKFMQPPLIHKLFHDSIPLLMGTYLMDAP